jgi:hypothetical protein
MWQCGVTINSYPNVSSRGVGGTVGDRGSSARLWVDASTRYMNIGTIVQFSDPPVPKQTTYESLEIRSRNVS